MIRSIAAVAILLLPGTSLAQTFQPDIPRAWNDEDVESFELPLIQPDRSPRYMTEREYYALKVRPIYRSYPVYAEGYEPEGYIEWLKQREPEIVFDSSQLETEADWIRAGKIVFESESSFIPADESPRASRVPPRWVSEDGIITGFAPRTVYIIRKKGVLELGSNSCAGCHTRLLSDGTLFEGGQGDLDQGVGPSDPSEVTEERLKRFLDMAWVNYGVPWIQTREEFENEIRNLKPPRGNKMSVFPRQGTSVAHPPHIPSLVGIQDIKYLDATGLVRHRSIADLMRYAIINTGLDTTAHFGDFQPTTGASAFSQEAGTRFSDEQLYALGLYLYSLRPPDNPNPMNDHARRGQEIFGQQGCAGCHSPPIYTNNMLTPAIGVQVPDGLRKTDDILDVSVGTDPALATRTRRATGFYKVPSLRGVWYRQNFGHTGQADTLEEWFDPTRLAPDYEPKGYHREVGPILGHEFGLKLSSGDRAALIAFLKTL